MLFTSLGVFLTCPLEGLGTLTHLDAKKSIYKHVCLIFNTKY